MTWRAVTRSISPPSATARTTMSRSVTMPISRSLYATGTEPMSSARMRRAISGTVKSGPTQLTCVVITWPTFSSVLRQGCGLVVLAGQAVSLAQVRLDGGQQVLGERLGVARFAACDFSLQQLDRLFVRTHHMGEVFLVEARALLGPQAVQHLRLLRAECGRQLDPLGLGHRRDLLVRIAMVLGHHHSELADGVARALVGRELPGLDLGPAALGQGLEERRIFRECRKRGEGQDDGKGAGERAHDRYPPDWPHRAAGQ